MVVKELLDRVGEHLSVSRSFGTAYEKDGLLIIPVALVAGGGGGGEGPTVLATSPLSGADQSEETVDDARARGDSPTGSGGGFGGVVLPVGAYVVKDNEVRWVPAVNVTMIVVVTLGVIRLLIRSKKRSRRRQHA